MSTVANPVQNTPVNTVVTVEFDPVEAVREIAKNWGWILAAGIVSAIGGTLALFAPALATGTVAVFIASMLFVVGCVNLAGIFFADKGMKLDSFLVGTVQVLMAAVMAFYPFESLISLTILVASVLMVDGIARMVLAWKARQVPGWGWTMASGVATIAMCVVILAGLPEASLWVIGVLVGVNLIMNGAARIAVAIEARKVAKAMTE